jgi:large subunit ribosomal protein L14
MVSVGTKLKVCDNSGARLVRSLKLKPHTSRAAKLGSCVKVSLMKLRSVKKKLNKKKLYSALIIASKTKHSRPDGSFIKFDSNSVLLLDEKFSFLGTRVLTPICKEVRAEMKRVLFKKIISLSECTL